MLNEIIGDMWTVGARFQALCIPTNGIVKADGCAVMGAGVALQACQRHFGLDRLLGASLRRQGNHVAILSKPRYGPAIIAFPTKYHWQDEADLELIQRSCRELRAIIFAKLPPFNVLLPRPGVGKGQLSWERDVRPLLIREIGDEPSITIISPS